MRGYELEKVLSLADPLAASMGFEILKAEFGSEHGNTVLRIYLDRLEGTVTLDDCEAYSRNLGTILDVEAGLPGRYHLEISSPGLNRPLATQKHFRAQLGKIVDVQTAQTIEGRRHFKGELKEVTGEGPGEGWVTVTVDSQDYRIPFSEIKKAHLDYFASEENSIPLRPGKKGRK